MEKDQNKKALDNKFLICTHIKKLTKKQVTQILQNPAQIKCQTHNQNYIDQSLCLHCNKIFCGERSKQKCISSHLAVNQGHIFELNIKNGSIYCSQCNQVIDQQLQKNKKNEQNEQIKKLKRFVDFIKQTYKKLKQIHEEMKKINININYRGLQNLGNTCFLNTDLQVLNYSHKLVQLYKQYKFNGQYSKSITTIKKQLPKQIQYFYDDVIQQGQNKIWHVVTNKKDNKKQQINDKLIKTISNCKFNQLIKLFFQQMNSSKQLQNPYQPTSILDYLSHIDTKYSLNQQQDAQQTLLFIIDILVQGQLISMNYDLQKYNKVQKLIGKQKISPTQRLFGFYLVSQIYCQSCKKINYTFDLTYHLSIDLSTKLHNAKQSILNHLSKNIQMKNKIYYKNLHYPESQFNQSSNKQGQNKQSKLLLPQFLYSFFQQQKLTKRQNYYQCSNCKSQIGLKKFYLIDLPQILIISIKRFNHKLVKNNHHVYFQQFIDLKDVTLLSVNQDNQKQYPITKYQLYSVIVHQGQTIHNGHYVCYVKTKQNIWIKCSDRLIKKVTFKQVKDQQAYVLLYQRIHQ